VSESHKGLLHQKECVEMTASAWDCRISRKQATLKALERFCLQAMQKVWNIYNNLRHNC